MYVEQSCGVDTQNSEIVIGREQPPSPSRSAIWPCCISSDATSGRYDMSQHSIAMQFMNENPRTTLCTAHARDDSHQTTRIHTNVPIYRCRDNKRIQNLGQQTYNNITLHSTDDDYSIATADYTYNVIYFITLCLSYVAL